MGERKKSGIYVILNLSNGKRYIGQAASIGDRWLTHRSHLECGRHHSKYLQASWKKHGAENFKFSVLEYVPLDKSLLAEREQFWFDQFKPEYNLAPVAGSCLGVKHPPRSAEFRKRMADMKRGHVKSPETIERQRAAARRINYKHSPEIRARISIGLTGKTKSQEAIEKHRQAMLGRKQPPEEIAKRSASLRGHSVSPETRAKIGAANAGKRLGSKHSEETKAKIGAAHLGRKRPDVTAARKGVPRTPEVVEAIRAGHLRRWADRAAEIKAALLANHTMSITKLAASIGADRETVSKYRKELQCQPPQPSASDSGANESPSLQLPLFTSP